MKSIKKIDRRDFKKSNYFLDINSEIVIDKIMKTFIQKALRNQTEFFSIQTGFPEGFKLTKLLLSRFEST